MGSALGAATFVPAGLAAVTVVPLDVPALADIREALAAGLAGRYAEVTVEVLAADEVPDLRQWGWVTAGLGTPSLLDVGSTDFLQQVACHNSTYNITEVVAAAPSLSHYAAAGGAVYGASALYRPAAGRNGECINNFRLDSGAGGSQSTGAVVADDGSLEVIPVVATDAVGPFGSLYVTDGAPAPVVKVSAGVLQASDEERFDWAMQKALTAAGPALGSVGLAGVVRLVTGEVTFHVMPDWAGEDLTPAQFAAWERYYAPMRAALECGTRLLSDESLFGATSEGAHTHCRAADLSSAGHYENDTLPAPSAPPHYFEAYLAPAVALVQVPDPTDPACDPGPSYGAKHRRGLWH